MPRKTLAAVMLATSGVGPLALAFIFSCCVLPFHKQLHAAIPLCHIAKAMTTDAAAESDGAATTTRAGEQLAKLYLRALPLALEAAVKHQAVAAPRGSAVERRERSHGAMRCDQDVGLLTLLAIFRI